MLPPIPKCMLPHSATHKYGAKTQDDNGNDTWASTQTFSHVRFEPYTKLVKTKDNQEVQIAALMFFDARNSLPSDVAFLVGDQISQTGGRAYDVVSVEPIYEAAKLHHYEIGCA